jgi:cystathionine beta-lyase
MPFLVLPGYLGREVIQVPMIDDGAGLFTFDLDGLAAAYRAGGDLLIFCNPSNPLGRVFTAAEISALTEVVDRHGGRVFADEIHAPLVYAPARHVPYAATSRAAAAHTITAISASKAWNLAGLKCAEVILTNPHDLARWDQLDVFAWHGASNAGVVANIAAFEHGGPWLDDAIGYLDESRHLLADLLATQLPAVRYRPPDGTYLAWLNCTALELPGSPGDLVTERVQLTVVDGPRCGAGGAGSLRLNFATPQPVLREMVERMAYALTAD